MDNTTYIDDYLEGRLNVRERKDFEVRLKEDPVFSAEYETQLSAQDLIKSIGVYSTKETLRRHENKTYIKSRQRFQTLIYAAAAILFLTIAMWFLFVTKNSASNDQLFAEFFTPYRDPIAVRGDAPADDERGKANTAYQAHDFVTAKSYYSLIDSPSPIDMFYYGLSALQSSDFNLAISLLSEVSETKSDYEQQARWYLALAYLKNDSKTNASNVLKRIVNEKGYKNVEALELLGKLNQ